MSISEQLREAIKNSPETYYRIAKEAEVDWGTLQRFVDGSRPNIRMDTIDRLCEYLDLDLRQSEGKDSSPHRGQSRARKR